MVYIYRRDKYSTPMAEGPVPAPYVEVLFCTCTPQGVPIYQNEAWVAHLGEGRHFFESLPPEDYRCVSAYISDAASGMAVTGEIFFVQTALRKEPTPLLLNFLPVHHAPEPHAVKHILITAELLAEPITWTSAQTHRRRLELLGRLTLGMAHDFNNLLSSVLGYAELLKQVAREIPERQQALLPSIETIEKAALDGAALIQKIQQYIRKDKKESSELLDPVTLLKDSLTLTRPYWFNEPRRQGIHITVRQNLQATPPIRGVAAELREVLINLLLNAIQAMPQGGTLYVSTHYTPEIGVQIAIRDTGSGIPDDILPHIFEPMFTTKGEQGTGMGLAISRGIIQSHNGDIRVTSTPGEGTTFTIILPAAEETTLTRDSSSSGKTVSNLRILVVDDEPALRNVLARLLTLKGHTVLEASSGKEALEIARREKLDLVITDLGMPEMHGRELAHHLKQSFPDLPVFLLTGHTEREEHGPDIDRILGKPFKIQDITRAIHEFF